MERGKGKWKMEKGEKWKRKKGFHFSISFFPFSLFPFFCDRRGSVAVQTFLLLPIFVLVVFGGYEIMKTMSVKQALHDGTYQAVRYLGLNPITDSSAEWENVARMFVVRELEAEVGNRARFVQVTVMPPALPPDCDDPFQVEAMFRWRFDVPFADRFSILLRESYEGSVVCG